MSVSPLPIRQEKIPRPLFARVLLEREIPKKVGSILLADESQKRLAFTKCRIIATGPTCDEGVAELIGKNVLIGRFAGDWINADGIPGVPSDDTKQYYIVQDEDILAALE